ncbi:hypothetical protein PTSG_13032 [Salpingoeca rosetta]|uniref:Uncharacterized protein n=1 Tax=Salpingoeca rosetta (strain ATCC 50818 / BSB-021) TaxID=946362 RepID=F2UR39_SALR5|nr:uncharacterized protein PTSG_13032 [Salpingoeca rosetta]EGD80094.1 hypothetical protein PTSG_13032 [Salpingoeca rosetta]|eukprot:XP_004988419.1 hypothetical protein PTSG_13032 [Salpingoeca rosetta]
MPPAFASLPPFPLFLTPLILCWRCVMMMMMMVMMTWVTRRTCWHTPCASVPCLASVKHVVTSFLVSFPCNQCDVVHAVLSFIRVHLRIVVYVVEHVTCEPLCMCTCIHALLVAHCCWGVAHRFIALSQTACPAPFLS